MLLGGLPRIILSDGPEVGFRVGDGEGLAAVVHGAEGLEDGGSRGLDLGPEGVAVRNEEVDGRGDAAADGVRCGDAFGVRAGVGGGAEHDHAGGAEGELGVGDGAVGAFKDGLALEAEGALQPGDGGGGVMVAEAGDDGRACWGWHGRYHRAAEREVSSDLLG